MQDQVGLDDAEAARRLAQDGPNALPGSEPKALWRIAANVLAEPMFLMLLAAGSIYLAIGDAAEAVFLLGSVLAIIGLALAQERKPSARWKPCVSCQRRAPRCCAAGASCALPAARWCAATCCCCTRATASPPTRSCCKARSAPTSPC